MAEPIIWDRSAFNMALHRLRLVLRACPEAVVFFRDQASRPVANPLEDDRICTVNIEGNVVRVAPTPEVNALLDAVEGWIADRDAAAAPRQIGGA